MKPEDRKIILSLAETPGNSDATVNHEEFLRHFATSDGRALGHSLLREALDRQDGEDVELALIVSFAFGFTASDLELLLPLSRAEWHHKHEDVVTALGKLRQPAGVDALYEAAQWVPDYLDYDENR
ncbi:MAG: hypothetical protein QOF98_3299, partial [Streptomyces sp.]|nr:hypothetical protein [Streptomyces sp.]